MEGITAQHIFLYLLVINLITVAVWWLDKRASIQGSWRIPEKTLLVFCFLGGSPGGFLASRLFRHKTKKSSFRARYILVVILQIILLIAYYTQRPH
ncbi:MAG: DUF1294 domain-containing protein [Proteobacteria bacterium]|nr:DUF1294 domain-containing protein [Pseudomonadota bacterium]